MSDEGPHAEGFDTSPKFEFVDERDPECVKQWPGSCSGEYDPRCCRFPKSCSAGWHGRRQVEP